MVAKADKKKSNSLGEKSFGNCAFTAAQFEGWMARPALSFSQNCPVKMLANGLVKKSVGFNPDL